MTEIEIKALVQSVIDKRKSKWNYSQFQGLNPDAEVKFDYPEYHPTYKIGVEMMEANRIHAEKGCFPAKLFRDKSPYQTLEEFGYVKRNYKQVTLPIGLDMINALGRAFNDGNFSIVYQNDDDKYSSTTLKDYVEKDINTFGSLNAFMKFLFTMIKVVDGEGVMVIKPFFNFDVADDGTRTISKTELNEPQPIYYDCSKVVAFSEEKYCLIDTTDNSQKKPPVYTYEFYDTENIYLFSYTVKDRKLDYELYYNHGWKQLPAEKIKGLPRLVDGKIIWQTILSFATDILDIIALDNSTLNISKYKCAYPIRVYGGRPCDFEYKDKDGNISRCSDGEVHDTVLGHKLTCPSCNGLGLRDRFSATHDFITNDEEKFSSISANKTPFQYVAPDTKILEYLENAIAKNEERARKMLHLQTSNLTVRGTENLTATGMALGDKSTSAFIKPISDQMFDTWKFLIDGIGWMRYKESYKPPVITKPASFDFNTEYDYMTEVSVAIASGMPPITIHAIIERYLHSHFHSDGQANVIYNLILSTDRLIGLQNIDIQIEVSKNLIAPWEVIIHDSAVTILKGLIRANEKFFEQKLEDQRQQLIDAAKAIADENKPVNNTAAAIAGAIV